MTTTLPTPAELAKRMQAEIIEAVRDGVVPVTVPDFASLHDYLDANCLGGTERLWEEAVGSEESDEAQEAGRDALLAVMNPAMDLVDAWIKSGGLAAGVN